MSTAQIIELSAFRPKAGASPMAGPSPMAQRLPGRRERMAARAAAAPPAETETGKNFRLRQQRHADWRDADAVRQYWQAAVKMESAISHAKRSGLPEGNLHPELAPRSCGDLVARYRAAIVAQLLMPASTMAEIAWKRAAFKAGDHEYTDVKSERIERAIADDVEFLQMHPTRRTRE